MVDQILSQEDLESQALFCLINDANKAGKTVKPDDQEDLSDFGSEAEDYDRLFMDFVSPQNQRGEVPMSQDRDSSLPGPQEMDICLD